MNSYEWIKSCKQKKLNFEILKIGRKMLKTVNKTFLWDSAKLKEVNVNDSSGKDLPIQN